MRFVAADAHQPAILVPPAGAKTCRLARLWPPQLNVILTEKPSMVNERVKGDTVNYGVQVLG